MTPRDGSRKLSGPRTAASGTPYPVDTKGDRTARLSIVIFLAGPVIWVAHFFVVYLVAEAGCTGGGPGLRALDPPVPGIVTLAATGVAGIASLATAVWGYSWWRRQERDARDDHPHAPLAFGGFLLSVLSFLTIVGVGVHGAFFGGC